MLMSVSQKKTQYASKYLWHFDKTLSVEIGHFQINAYMVKILMNQVSYRQCSDSVYTMIRTMAGLQ